MKKLLIGFILSLMCLLVSVGISARRGEGVIVIDPGHDCEDPGACAYGNQERNINAQLSYKIAKGLQNHGYEVYFSHSVCSYEGVPDDIPCLMRDGDFVNHDGWRNRLIEVRNKVNGKNPDLMISIHHNASSSSEAKGMEIYWRSSGTPGDSHEKSQNLANLVREECQNLDYINFRKIDDNDFLINSVRLPSILSECGFMTNFEELNNIINQNNQQKMAECFLRAVDKYFDKYESKYKKEAENVIVNGTYEISSRLSNDKVIDISGASKDNGANVQLYEKNNTDAQKFILEIQNDGFYVIRSLVSGKVLDVQGGGKSEGTNVWQYEFNGTDAQKWNIKHNDDGYYYLISKSNGLCLDVAGGISESGTNIQCWTENSSNAQKFKFNRTSNFKAKIVSSKLNLNKVIDISNGSKDNGANVQLYENNNTNAQNFIFEIQNDGSYVIRSAGSGKVLDVQGGGKFEGTNVWQYEFNGTDAQKWNIKYAGEGYYYFVSKCNKLCLDVSGACAENGSNIQCWTSNDTDAQRFRIDEISELPNDTYEIVSNLNDDKVIDISDGSSDNGANVQLYERNGTNAQKFRVKSAENGYYIIESVNSGKVLDVRCAGQFAGVNVWQYEFNNTDAQKWSIKSTGNNYYIITSKCNGLCLDINGGSIGNGTNIQCWTSNNTNAQKFKFQNTEEKVTIDENYPIKGKSNTNADQMARYYKSKATYPEYYHNNGGAPNIETFCKTFYEEASAEGIKPELAFVQCLLETNFLQFGGDVKIDQYNFAGLGATGNGERGLNFSDVRTGIRAQIQHLKAYACNDNLVNSCVDPRFRYVKRGRAHGIKHLSGTWAADSQYACKLVKYLNELLSI